MFNPLFFDGLVTGAITITIVWLFTAVARARRIAPDPVLLAESLSKEVWAIFKGRAEERGSFQRGDDYTQGYADGAGDVAEALKNWKGAPRETR